MTLDELEKVRGKDKEYQELERQFRDECAKSTRLEHKLAPFLLAAVEDEPL